MKTVERYFTCNISNQSSQIKETYSEIYNPLKYCEVDCSTAILAVKAAMTQMSVIHPEWAAALKN
jgi:hypothetical protein